MVNVHGIELSDGAINPARDIAEQTESAGCEEDGSEEKRERRNHRDRERRDIAIPPCSSFLRSLPLFVRVISAP